MEYTIQVLIKRIIRLRKQLYELEAKRNQFDSDVPSDLWSDLINISRTLDKEEQKAQAAGRIKSAKVNKMRSEIIKMLDQYNVWRDQMRESEKLFLTNIVRPGNRLAHAVRQRQYLEDNYQKIRTKIELEIYTHLEELEIVIRQILIFSETDFDPSKESIEDKYLGKKENDIMSFELDMDEFVDEIERDKLVREFKRIVLPAKHPDTSDAGEEEFNRIFEVYENRDFVLMEAYIAQCREKIDISEEEDVLEYLQRIDAQQTRYEKLAGRLKKRVENLKQDLTKEEMDDLDTLRQNLRKQGEIIRKETQIESEKINQLRDKIEGLIDLYLDLHPGNGES